MIDFIDDKVADRYGKSPLDPNVGDIPEYYQILRSIRDDVDGTNAVQAMLEINACQPYDGDEHISHLIEVAFHQNHIVTIQNWLDYLKERLMNPEKQNEMEIKNEHEHCQSLKHHYWPLYLADRVHDKTASELQREQYSDFVQHPDFPLYHRYRAESSNRVMATNAMVIKRQNRFAYNYMDYKDGIYQSCEQTCIFHRWANSNDVKKIIDNLCTKLIRYSHQM